MMAKVPEIALNFFSAEQQNKTMAWVIKSNLIRDYINNYVYI